MEKKERLMRGCLQILLVFMVCSMLMLVALGVCTEITAIVLPNLLNSHATVPPPETYLETSAAPQPETVRTNGSTVPGYTHTRLWMLVAVPLSMLCCLLLFALLLVAFRRRRRREDPPVNESRMLQELYHRSLTMEKRIEALETLLLGQVDSRAR